MIATGARLIAIFRRRQRVLYAFDFSPDAILAAAAKMACAADLCPTLARLRKTLRDLPTDAFVSTRLNNYSDREVFDALLDHLESHFQAAAESQLRSSAPGDA